MIPTATQDYNIDGEGDGSIYTRSKNSTSLLLEAEKRTITSNEPEMGVTRVVWEGQVIHLRTAEKPLH